MEYRNRTVSLELAVKLARQVKAFVDEKIIPYESQLMQCDQSSRLLQADLIQQARASGLCNLFYPLLCNGGGKLASLEDYLINAEQEGLTEFSQEIFGSYMVLDAYMILRFGNKEIHKKFLEPMVSGAAMPSYGMAEPGHNDSTPGLISTTAQFGRPPDD